MKRAESISSDRERKRVRISEEKPDVHHLQQNDALSEQERHASWWTHSEYTKAKDSMKDICRGYRHVRRYSDCLSDAYETACAMASSAEEDTNHSQQQEESPDATLIAPEVPLPDEVSLKHGKNLCMHFDSFQSF
jgi:hypothetical protein